MKYNDFFANLYMGRSAGAIVGYKSKEKIPEFILKAALKEDDWCWLPTSNSTYGKWFDGSRTPDGNLWGVVATKFQEDQFIDQLAGSLNDSTLGQVMIRFHIPINEGDTPDKRLLAFALAKQFHAIAEGDGNANDIAKDFYKPDTFITTFPKYAERALDKFSKIKMPFSEDEERVLEDIYVCNRLSSRANINEGRRSRSSRSMETLIEKASLENIGEYSKKTVLVANGGMGKSMLLQRLFVKSIREHERTGVLPVLIELRNFSENNDLVTDYIVKAVKRFDDDFTEKKARDLLESGKCQILLDAADEIDLSDAKAFQTQLSELVDRYPFNQYVMASRECDMMRSIRGFSKLYLQPFDKEQANALIANLLPDPEDKDLRDEISQYVDGDFLKKHQVFATNPMLLTFIIMRYPIDKTFYGKQYLFYRTAYDTLVTVHDQEKEAYSRIYHSAKDSEEFTKVFREFCAITYLDRVHEFDQATFEGYFNRLKSKAEVSNPKVMTMKNFVHDACATACMMYEEEYKILYVDPGFQEYLFAEYNYYAEPEEMIEFGKNLWNVPEGEFEGGNAFGMLCEYSKDKVESTYFIPYLNEIFKGRSDEDAFIAFLQNGYGELDYQVEDTDLIASYLVEKDAEWQPIKSPIMEPSNIIFSLILKEVDTPGLLCFAVFEDALNYPMFMTAGIFGEDYYDASEKRQKILARRLLRQDVENLPKYEKTHNVDGFVRDSDHNLVCFGHEYKVDLSLVAKEPDQYQPLIEVLKTRDDDVWQAFQRIKKYYDALTRRHRDA